MFIISKALYCFPVLFFLLIISSTISVYLTDGSTSTILELSTSYDNPTADLSTSWVNEVTAPSDPYSVNFTDGYVRAVLLRETSGPKYACGFFCNGANCDKNYLFAIFIVETYMISNAAGIEYKISGIPQVVWSANRNNPVKINSSLVSMGDLVLKDDDGRVAWSTKTSGKGVVGMNLTETGNLVLFDSKNNSVWDSFDYPTDSLVPGQKLGSGQKLTASVSNSNWTGGLYSLTLGSNGVFGLFAYIESNPPELYFAKTFPDRTFSNMTDANYCVEYLDGSLTLYIDSNPREEQKLVLLPTTSTAQYMKLGFDGHLRVYQLQYEWNETADLFTEEIGRCGYPLACGKNSLCSNGQCKCPKSKTSDSNYFKPVNDIQPDLGCEAITPLNCEASSNHTLIELNNTTYFTFNSDIDNTDIETCKSACLKNCSCKAALFLYGMNLSSGDCYMPSQLLSMMVNNNEKTQYNASAHVKVQVVPRALSPSSESSSLLKVEKKKNNLPIILGSIGGGLAVLLIFGFFALMIVRKKDGNDGEEDYLDLTGMTTRFSYEEIKLATENFIKKLGEGGFGSVFEGTLDDGSKIAVKCLDGVGQVRKSFLAEVESIGSIHHVNLVRLIGFCSEKTHRLLVYEHMFNGSLDRWIYEKNKDLLGWQFRRKIVHDIAKGLSYLHEDCRHKIIHLDIKPQNILLDENFNAKVGDFGLSKLIDRDQSQVMTTIRGTPGYLAPEWLSSIITEKVDVYAFGIVVLEIMCGRKIFDRAEDEEDMHLLNVFKRKAEEERLIDLVDKRSQDMQSHAGEVLVMIKLAAWCLQSNYVKRPSMSMVIKVLEGVLEVEQNLDYSLSTMPYPNLGHKSNINETGTSLLLPSVLSGPR